MQPQNQGPSVPLSKLETTYHEVDGVMFRKVEGFVKDANGNEHSVGTIQTQNMDKTKEQFVQEELEKRNNLVKDTMKGLKEQLSYMDKNITDLGTTAQKNSLKELKKIDKSIEDLESSVVKK
jgi:hypothetical protein